MLRRRPRVWHSAAHHWDIEPPPIRARNASSELKLIITWPLLIDSQRLSSVPTKEVGQLGQGSQQVDRETGRWCVTVSPGDTPRTFACPPCLVLHHRSSAFLHQAHVRIFPNASVTGKMSTSESIKKQTQKVFKFYFLGEPRTVRDIKNM